MPEFILDHGSSEASERFSNLDAFTRAYIEAAFFTIDEDLSDLTLGNLSDTAWREAERVCREFQDKHKALLNFAHAKNAAYGDEPAGRDLWYSRNGHGTGYWDSDLDTIGDALHAAAHRLGETDLYVGDDYSLYFS